MKTIRAAMSVFLITMLFVSCSYYYKSQFVSIGEIDPSIKLEIRYFSDHNFVGRRIKGYEAPNCLLTRQAANALSMVQKDLQSMGHSLLVYDCYRPIRAVKDFENWARDLSDTKMKSEFYPDIDKKELFKEGYVASKSSHSRGSTVDLTIEKVDMGTPFDFFSPASHTENTDIGDEALANRLLLKSAMIRHGFVNYDKEWWHYTLNDEPYTDKYFDFPVK